MFNSQEIQKVEFEKVFPSLVCLFSKSYNVSWWSQVLDNNNLINNSGNQAKQATSPAEQNLNVPEIDEQF